MLNSADNEVLTRVGPGTPLGKMMRRYWHPIALSAEVAEPDGDPLRTKLLGQRFVVFRDTAGKVGVLDEMCMHRGVSLALGRNEEGGLRCLYHGWKFAVDGTILETPNHADCRLRERLKAPAYPVREQSGLIWTYIGPKDLEPPFRMFEYDTVPSENRFVIRANTKANWLPLWEGGLDSSHVGVLHTNLVRPSWVAKAKGEPEAPIASWDNMTPEYEIEDTDFGYHYCAFRDVPGKEGQLRNARLVPAMLPYMRIIPSKDSHSHVHEVPLDDSNTATYVVLYSQTKKMAHDTEEEDLRAAGLDHPLYNPKTRDFRLEWHEGLGQDRSLMKTSWTGIRGLGAEDFVMSRSLEDWDRSGEHLVTADIAVVRMRRRVLEAISKHEATGEAPLGVSLADMSKVIAYDHELALDEKWQDRAPDHKRLYQRTTA